MQASGANRLLQATNAYRSQAVEETRRKPQREDLVAENGKKATGLREDLARSIGKGTYIDIRI